MNERQYVLAANILNKHGAQVEMREREKWETLKNIKKPKNIVICGEKYQNSDMEKE